MQHVPKNKQVLIKSMTAHAARRLAESSPNADLAGVGLAPSTSQAPTGQAQSALHPAAEQVPPPLAMHLAAAVDVVPVTAASSLPLAARFAAPSPPTDSAIAAARAHGGASGAQAALPAGGKLDKFKKELEMKRQPTNVAEEACSVDWAGKWQGPARSLGMECLSQLGVCVCVCVTARGRKCVTTRMCVCVCVTACVTAACPVFC